MSDIFLKHGIKLQTSSNYSTIRPFLENQYNFYPESHTSPIRYMVLSQSQDIIATSGDDKQIIIWILPSLKISGILSAHEGSIISLSLSQNSQFLISGGSDKIIIVWDLEIMEVFTYFDTEDSEPLSIDISPNNKYIVAGCTDKLVRIWNLEKEYLIARLSGHQRYVRAVRITKDNRFIVSSGDSFIKFWDLESRVKLFELEHGRTNVADLVVARNGKYLVSGGWDGSVKVWDIEKRKVKSVFKESGAISCVSISDDCSLIIAGTADWRVIVWELNSLKKEEFKEHKDNICGVAVSFDNKKIFSASLDRRIFIWDRENNEAETITQHYGKIKVAAITQDKNLIFTAGEDKVIKVWDYKNNKFLYSLHGPSSIVSCLCISDNGKYLLSSASTNQILHLWDLDQKMIVSNITSQGDTFFSAIFYKDDRYLIAGGHKALRIWNKEEDMQVGFIQTIQTRTESMSTTKSKKLLVTTSDKQIFLVWYLEKYIKKIEDDRNKNLKK